MITLNGIVREDSKDPSYIKFQEWFQKQENVRGEQISVIAFKAWKQARTEAFLEAFERLKL